MRGFVWFIVLLACSGVVAFHDVDSLIVDYGGYNNILVEHLSFGSSLVGLNESLHVYPLDGQVLSQDLRNLSRVGDFLFFESHEDFVSSGWSFNFTINNSRRIFSVSVNPVFPFSVDSLPAGLSDYLGFDSVIDKSSQIKVVADSVVSGVSDYLTAVQRLSDWVNSHVSYTFTEPYISGTIPSSVTVSGLNGVCDEFTVLFISLCRSVGIPARYVTGYAYGNVLGLSSFGAHAWAEVYVPGFGWLSVDPTYGEHGWLDASHVSVTKAWNVTRNYLSSSFSYVGSVSVSDNLPSFMTSSFGAESSGFSLVSVVNESLFLNASVSVSKSVVGSGEYFLATLSVSNPSSFFVPLSYDVLTTKEMSLINASLRRPLLLSPDSVTKSYTIFQAPVVARTGSRSSHTVSIHPFSLYIPRAGYVFFNVTVDPWLDATSSLDELVSISREEFTVVKDLLLSDLRVTPGVSYDGRAVLGFSLLNRGNVVLDGLSVNVYGDSVSNFSSVINHLGINEVFNASVPLNVTGYGNGSVRVYVSVNDLIVSNSTFFASGINPGLVIDYVGASSFVDNPVFNLSVSNPLSVDVPLLNLSIIAPGGSLNESFNPGVNELIIDSSFPKEWLSFGDNTVAFRISYVDDYGTIFIGVKNVTLNREGRWYELLLQYVTDFINSIIKLFS